MVQKRPRWRRLMLLVVASLSAVRHSDASRATRILESASSARLYRFNPLLRIKTTLESAVSDYVTQLSFSKLQRVVSLPAAGGTNLVRFRQIVNDIEFYGSGVTVHVDRNETEVYDVHVSQRFLRAAYAGNLSAQYSAAMNSDVLNRTAARGQADQSSVADMQTNSAVDLLLQMTLPTTPRIAPNIAIRIVANAFGFSTLQIARYSWNPSTKLVYYADGQKKSSPSLCYIVKFFIHLPNSASASSPNAIVDALDGTILDSWNGCSTIGVQTTINGVGGNSGPVWGMKNYVDIPVTQLDTSNCSYSSGFVRIQNMRNTTSGSFVDAVLPCSQVANSSYDQTNGAYAPLNDLARHAQAVYNMFTQLLERSPTGSQPMLIRAHYGSQYENANWDGTQMNVGDGGRAFYPLVSVDLVGHEFAHAFTNSYSALQYSGQSGGVNEAYSDMAGETAEHFLFGSNDFIIGKNVTKNGQGIRYMCNPTADQSSIDNANNYTPTMDVHYSSGVFNKAFCILSTTTGWDIETAFVVFSYANMAYWQQLSNFTSAACGVQKSARYLGVSVSDVTSAFLSVGISVNC